MAWLAVDKDGTENIFDFKPTKLEDYWISGGYYSILDNGAIEKFIGKKLTWDDEPIEIYIKTPNRMEIYTEINWYVINILPSFQFKYTPTEKLSNNTFLGRTEIVFSWLIFSIGLFIRNK